MDRACEGPLIITELDDLDLVYLLPVQGCVIDATILPSPRLPFNPMYLLVMASSA